MNVFIAALFIRTKGQKQLKCVSADEWITQFVYTCNGVLIYATT